MALSEQERDAMAEAIARHVPEDLLALIVEQQGVAAARDLENWRTVADDMANGRLFALARRVTEAYDAAGQTQRLAVALVRNMRWSNGFLLAMQPFSRDGGAHGSLQALHRSFDNTFGSRRMADYMRRIEPRICWIVGARQDGAVIRRAQGTGFLVGPDLVLTNEHVIKDMLLPNGTPDPAARLTAYFDYVDEPRVKEPDQRPSHCRPVAFDANWLPLRNAHLSTDGTWNSDPRKDPQILQDLDQHLDFALIRLAEPVGLGATSAGGGEPRGWIDLPAASPLLQAGARIVISQHPQGEPRHIDYGFLFDRHTSRFWYDTETDHGSSGSPCFSRDFELVGIHNAGVAVLRLNQGVPISAIQAAIAGEVAASVARHPAVPRARPWNVGVRQDYRVVLGRRTFLDWIAAAREPQVAGRSHRLYVAEAPEAGSGKTFSVEILRHELKAATDQRVVVFGAETADGTVQRSRWVDEMLPQRAEDLIRVLADRLGVPAERLATMPPRPRLDPPAESPNVDKLRTWASVDLPQWFAGVLDEPVESRTVGEDARIVRDYMVAKGLKVPQEILDDLDSTTVIETRPTDRWHVAWIVFDDLNRLRFAPDVLDLVAGLAGTARDEAEVQPILRRLRWLFLGTRPDFIQASHDTRETLNPGMYGVEEGVAVLTDICSTSGIAVDPDKRQAYREVLEETIPLYAGGAVEPSMRLSRLQGLVTALLDLYGLGGSKT